MTKYAGAFPDAHPRDAAGVERNPGGAHTSGKRTHSRPACRQSGDDARNPAEQPRGGVCADKIAVLARIARTSRCTTLT